MSEERKDLQLAGGFSLQPKDIKEAMEFAKLMADSELVPKDFRQKPGNVLIAVQMGAELGVKPLQAIQGIAVINGKPSVYGDLGKAILRAGGCRIDEDDARTVQKNACARCKITRPNGEIIERTFSKEDAEKAGLWGKQGPWSQYPWRQMSWRAFWFAARDGAADLLKGMSGAEELRDVEAVDVETIPMPKRSEEPTAPPEPAATKSPAPKADPTPPAKPKDTPPAQTEETDVEATVTIENVKKFNDGHFEVLDVDGVVYTTKEEGIATAAKEAKGKVCAISFRPQEKGAPVLTHILPVAKP